MGNAHLVLFQNASVRAARRRTRVERIRSNGASKKIFAITSCDNLRILVGNVAFTHMVYYRVYGH